jgi:hypothetical protein
LILRQIPPLLNCETKLEKGWKTMRVRNRKKEGHKKKKVKRDKKVKSEYQLLD